MQANRPTSCTAFAGTERVASGSPAEVARPGKSLVDAGDPRALLIFADVRRPSPSRWTFAATWTTCWAGSRKVS